MSTTEIPRQIEPDGKAWTVAELLEFDARGESYELTDGRLVETSMSRESNSIGFIVAHQIQIHLDETAKGWLFVNDHPFDLFGDGRVIRKPDVAFVKSEKIPGGPDGVGIDTVTPDLVVEVVSPNDRVSELMIKIDEYLKASVPLIWVIYPEIRRVHVYRDGDATPAIVSPPDALPGRGVIDGFSLDLAHIFPTTGG